MKREDNRGGYLLPLGCAKVLKNVIWAVGIAKEDNKIELFGY